MRGELRRFSPVSGHADYSGFLQILFQQRRGHRRQPLCSVITTSLGPGVGRWAAVGRQDGADGDEVGGVGSRQGRAVCRLRGQRYLPALWRTDVRGLQRILQGS